MFFLSFFLLFAQYNQETLYETDMT